MTEHAAGPRLLATTGAMLLNPVGWVLDTIAEAGFDGAEVVLTHNLETRDPTRLLNFARMAGLDVPVVHGPYMLPLRSVPWWGYAEKTRRSLETAEALGAHTMVAHAPFRWERRARAWLDEAIANGELDGYGARFGMENLFPVARIPFSTVTTVADLAPFPHLVFDTSHFAVAGIDLVEAWDALAPRVVHVHVSDNHGRGRDDHAPIGAGTLPLDRFLAHVGRSGYRGTITLELDVREHQGDRAALVAFWAEQRRRVARALTGELPAAPQPG